MTIRIGVTKVALLDLGFSKNTGDGYSPGVHEFYLEHPTEPVDLYVYVSTSQIEMGTQGRSVRLENNYSVSVEKKSPAHLPTITLYEEVASAERIYATIKAITAVFLA